MSFQGSNLSYHGAAPRAMGNHGVHGLGLRPTRADLTRPDAALIAEYTAGVDRAVRANRGRAGRERMLEAAAGWGSKR